MKEGAVLTALTAAGFAARGSLVDAGGQQVAMWFTDDHGDFSWGWVQHRTKDGRTDCRSWPEFIDTLKEQHA